jgi:hypothetical protein
MSAQDNPYVRVYYSIKRDAKFEMVYLDDRLLATWLRLLLEADASWPAPASVPRHARPAALRTLCEAGLVEMAGLDLYYIHGLQNEREGRSAIGKLGAESRWSKEYGSNAEAIPKQYRTDAVASGEAMHSEPSHSEPNRTEPLQAPESGPDCWYWVTTRYPDKRANPGLWEFVSRLAEEYGVARLWEVMRVEFARDQNKGTLLSRTEAVLAREADRYERTAEQNRLAEARRPVVLKPQAPELTDAEAEAQARAYREGR